MSPTTYRRYQGLHETESQGLRRLAVKGDSELVINQMNGHYKHAATGSLLSISTPTRLSAASSVTYTWISRQENAVADSLASQEDGVR